MHGRIYALSRRGHDELADISLSFSGGGVDTVCRCFNTSATVSALGTVQSSMVLALDALILDTLVPDSQAMSPGHCP